MLGNLGRMAAEGAARVAEGKSEDKEAYEGMRGMFEAAKRMYIANNISKLKAEAMSPATHEKIFVAPTTDEDIPALKKFFEDEDYIKYLDASKETTEMSDAEIEKCFVKKDDVVKFTLKKESGEVIGSFSATVRGKNTTQIEIGYSLGTAYQGKAYAGAACKAICDEIVKIPEVKSFIAFYHKNNEKSGKKAKEIFEHLKENDNSLKIEDGTVKKDGKKPVTRFVVIKK